MILKQTSLIKGLYYHPNFITQPQKQALLALIHSTPWCHQLHRQQQYYGIKYFQTKINNHILQPTISNDHQELRKMQFVIDKCIKQYGIFDEQDPPNQILVNQYQQQHKLGMHVEDVMAFGPIIAGLSLGSKEYLRLMNVHDKSKEYLLELQDRSCYVLRDEARYQWRHGIGRALNGQRYKDSSFERISLTIRHVIQSRRRVQSPTE